MGIGYSIYDYVIHSFLIAVILMIAKVY